MGVGAWVRKLLGRHDGQAAGEPSPAAPQERAAREPAWRKLAQLGDPDGPDEAQALGLLQRVEGTPDEGGALVAIAAASERAPLPAGLLSRCAVLLAERGDRSGALRLLQDATRPQDLLLRADLLSEQGQLALALATVQRLLARDIDYPGARERHRQWSELVGATVVRRASNEATIAVPTAEKSPYRLLREAARGGSGTIYEAYDDALGRAVAYKVYHRGAAEREQLQREARLAVSLAGPGVVRIYDACFEQGWLALEWVGLGSVRDLLAAGRGQELAPVAGWAEALARAIARVHAAGLVHGDIKPANVLMRSPQDPVLSDFGISAPFFARALGGSAGYLSPERLEGAALSPRDDIYGFGRVLEDVLARVPDAAMGAVAMRCLGKERPEDGAQLAKLVHHAAGSAAEKKS
jgi:serine/threonine-protein kinase